MARYCQKCGALLDAESGRCPNCDINNDDGAKSSGKTLRLVAIILICILIIGLVVYLLSVLDVVHFGRQEPVTAPRVKTTTTLETTTREALTTEIASVSINAMSGTGASNHFFYPDSSKMVTPYDAYVFCTDTEIQDYVKMRYGPSKESYDVIQIIQNNEFVRVQSESINGWTLVEYQNVKGWVRSDFIFK